MSCYSLTTLELAFATANLRLYDPLRNIDTYALNTYPRYLSLTTLETACYSTAVLLEHNMRICPLIASRRIERYMTAYPRTTMLEYRSALFLRYRRL